MPQTTAAAAGDAIRDAFFGQAGATMGCTEAGRCFTSPDSQQKERLEATFFGRVLLSELVAPEAVYQADKAAHNTRPETYWARRWKQARGVAVGEVFPGGLPPKTQLPTVFSYSPW